MVQIKIVLGKWLFQQGRWVFGVVKDEKAKLIKANNGISYEEFVEMVIRLYQVDMQTYKVELSYMFPKKVLVTLPENTPPIDIGNQRQLDGFLEQLKSEALQICLELKERGEDADGCHTKNEEAEKVSDNDDDPIFDYCDDSDGASSGDEDFRDYGLPLQGEEPNSNEGSTPASVQVKGVNQHVRLELDALNSAVGQRYESKDALETRMKIFPVLEQFDFSVDKSTKDLYVIKCWVEGYTWRVRAFPVGLSSEFCIRVYESVHSCSVTERSARARQATPEILAILYMDSVGGVDSKILPKHVGESLIMRFGVKMNYWKAHRTLLCARNMVRGSAEKGYSELPTYLYHIRRQNPGTFTRLEVDGLNIFKYLFLSFGASLNGFPFMRKVIVVDGTFLQGKYKGTLLTATTQDGNFQIFPIAFAVVDTENDESWEWFFQQLSYVIQDDEELAIISDRHIAIGNAIGKVYPKSSRGICTYHLYKNILLRFGSGDAYRLVKKAVNAYRVSDFNTLYDEIKALNPALHTYLESADVQKWTRVYFPGDRYNLLTSNIAESINKVISSSRSLPVVRLLDAIRLMMTRWFADRRAYAGSTKTTLTRGVEKLLEKRVPLAKSYTVEPIDLHHAQVTSGTSLNVVNLTLKKCTCRRFDIEKIPCVHAIAAAEACRKSRITLCHPYYHTSYLRNAYSSSIMPRDAATPVPENVATTLCLPPAVRPPPGRPKKTRIKSVLEKAKGKKRPRKQHTCSRCLQSGHNATTCKA